MVDAPAHPDKDVDDIGDIVVVGDDDDDDDDDERRR